MHRKSMNRTRAIVTLVAAMGLAVPALAQEKSISPKPSNAPQITKGAQPGTPATPGKPSVDSGAHGIQHSDPAQSPLTWEAMTHDFGNIADTTEVAHVFKFTNNSGGRVTIQSATGSCGCTVPELKKKSFESGETGEMTVRFNPHGRRGLNPKAVTIMFSEPAGTPNTVLTISSNVQPLVIIDPPKMYMMEVDSKSGQSAEITVSGRKSDFQVLGVDCSNPNIQISVGEKREVQIDGDVFQQYPVSVMVKAGSPVGEIQTEFVIRTNEERVASENYVFVSEVVGDLKATPNKLALRAYTPNIPFANVVVLESRSNKPFHVTGIEVEGRDDMQLVADLETNTVNNRTTYTIRLNGVTPDITGIVSGEIVVHTDSTENPLLRLPFSTSIRGSQAGFPTNQPVSH